MKSYETQQAREDTQSCRITKDFNIRKEASEISYGNAWNIKILLRQFAKGYRIFKNPKLLEK